MRKIFYIIIILLIASCKNIVQNKLAIQNITVIDTVVPITAEEYEVKTDTLTLVSQPFTLNNLLCFWKHSFLIYDDYGLDIEAKLFDYKTKKVLLEYEESPKHPEYYYDYKSKTYFESINKNYFNDFNFDGLKDFSVYSYGSTPMTSGTAIYLFNNKTKTFEISDLSDTVIEEIDSINKILTTHSWSLEETIDKKYHFDKSGKILFLEQFKYSNDTTEIIHYTKIIGEKIVEQ